MARGPIWTKQEDKVLLTQVRKNPHNLRLAFEKTARLLENRNSYACSKRWYYKYHNCNPKELDSICFVTISDKKMSTNSKIKMRDTKKRKARVKVNKTKKGLWQKLKDFLKL